MMDEAESVASPKPVAGTANESAVVDPEGESAADSVEASTSEDDNPPVAAGSR
jgi:hypothetical protein